MASRGWREVRVPPDRPDAEIRFPGDVDQLEDDVTVTPIFRGASRPARRSHQPRLLRHRQPGAGADPNHNGGITEHRAQAGHGQGLNSSFNFWPLFLAGLVAALAAWLLLRPRKLPLADVRLGRAGKHGSWHPLPAGEKSAGYFVDDRNLLLTEAGADSGDIVFRFIRRRLVLVPLRLSPADDQRPLRRPDPLVGRPGGRVDRPERRPNRR